MRIEERIREHSTIVNTVSYSASVNELVAIYRDEALDLYPEFLIVTHDENLRGCLSENGKFGPKNYYDGVGHPISILKILNVFFRLRSNALLELERISLFRTGTRGCLKNPLFAQFRRQAHISILEIRDYSSG